MEITEKALLKCRPLHAEAILPLTIQVKCCFKLELYDEMDLKMGQIFELVKFHLGSNHPILIQIFEEIGDFFSEFYNEEAYTINFYTQVSILLKSEHKINLYLTKYSGMFNSQDALRNRTSLAFKVVEKIIQC